MLHPKLFTHHYYTGTFVKSSQLQSCQCLRASVHSSPCFLQLHRRVLHPSKQLQWIILLLLLPRQARQALPTWGGDKNVPKRWWNPPDSECGGICLALVKVHSHFIDWRTTQWRLSLPTADVLSIIVKQSMLTDHTVKLQSVLRLCSGFYRSKHPTNSI